MRINKNVLTALVVACLLLLAGQALAEENVIDVPNATMIAPDSGNARYLMKPEIGLPDTTIVIDRATLDLWISPQAEDTTYISIRIHPITTEWDSETVSWNSPWITPGGDFNEINYAEYAVFVPAEQNIQVDLTDLCMRWADGRLPYYGFLIDISESSLAGVTFMNGEKGNGPFAKLILIYSRPCSE